MQEKLAVEAACLVSVRLLGFFSSEESQLAGILNAWILLATKARESGTAFSHGIRTGKNTGFQNNYCIFVYGIKTCLQHNTKTVNFAYGFEIRK